MNESNELQLSTMQCFAPHFVLIKTAWHLRWIFRYLSYVALCGGLSGAFQGSDHICIFALSEYTAQIDMGLGQKSPRKGYLTGRQAECLQFPYTFCQK